jgi:outer membrane biosynthesis protein TonB
MNSLGRRMGAFVISVAVHSCAIAALFLLAWVTPPKKIETIKVQLVSAADIETTNQPEAVTTKAEAEAPKPESPKPAPPKPEPPKPEPPKPEPPKPEPPKPEPPKPEPPKPEPPKPEAPKPAPPKPEAPKPAPPKPAPAPPKPEPPKPEPPKPAPVAPVKSHRERLRERLAAAETKSAPAPAPRATTPRRSERELADSFTRGLAKGNSSAPALPPALSAAGKAVEEKNYAEQIVRPLFYARWQQPTRGELQQNWPTPVEVTFTVLADGRIASWRLSARSNSAAMNSSVENLMRQVTQLTPFSQLGINSASLRIVVNMELGART